MNLVIRRLAASFSRPDGRFGVEDRILEVAIALEVFYGGKMGYKTSSPSAPPDCSVQLPTSRFGSTTKRSRSIAYGLESCTRTSRLLRPTLFARRLKSQKLDPKPVRGNLDESVEDDLHVEAGQPSGRNRSGS